MSKIVERRKAPRISKSLPLKIKHQDFDFITETKNISAIGAYCSVSSYIPLMTKLKIMLILPKYPESGGKNYRIECTGVVVRTEKQSSQNKSYNIAIYFNDIKERDKEKISSYIDWHLRSAVRNRKPSS